MRSVFEKIRLVADTKTTVLITGESGTGKELVAHAIHHNSGRCNKPFIPVNCPAIPDTLIESELFGHEKGAFTGATDRRIGLFQAAQGGTLFIDEIGEMNAGLQAKLLRAIETHRIMPLGSRSEMEVDDRLVAATNRSGDVVLRGLRLCEPCGHLQEELAVKGVIKGLCHRGGLRAQVLRGGLLRSGDHIQLADRA